MSKTIKITNRKTGQKTTIDESVWNKAVGNNPDWGNVFYVEGDKPVPAEVKHVREQIKANREAEKQNPENGQ